MPFDNRKLNYVRCNDAGRGLSHGHRQHACKISWRFARVVPEICSQTDSQTQTHTDVLISILRNRSR